MIGSDYGYGHYHLCTLIQCYVTFFNAVLLRYILLNNAFIDFGGLIYHRDWTGWTHCLQ